MGLWEWLFGSNDDKTLKKNGNKNEKTKNKSKNSQVSSKDNINDVFDAESSTSEKAMAFENKKHSTGGGNNQRRVFMVLGTLVFVALVVGTTYYIKKK